MRVSRRGFVAGGAAVGASAALTKVAPSFAQPAQQPVRLPLAEFIRQPRLVDALRRGVQVMRSRAGSDPKSWFWQGAIHAFNDEIFGEAVLLDPRVAQVDQQKYWNQCPHFGQSSANFLIWHRAYLYYFERILREAAQEPELAVPYWNYDDPAQRGFPSLYGPQFLDPDRRVPNSLYHRNRELAFVTGRIEVSEAVAAAARARAATQFFSSPGSNGFAGDVREDGGTIQGEIERRPHNDLHLAVGGVIGTNNGAMADVPTAAFDPVFWIHHANIDRMWREWAATPGKTWGPLPPESWFDETPWTFIDVDGSEQRLSRRFYLDPTNLDVRYHVEPATSGLQLPRAERQFANMLAVEALRTRPLYRQTLAMRAEPDTEGISAVVAADRVAALDPNRIDTLRPRDGKRLTVRLSGITYDRLPASGFRVYLAPAGVELTENTPYFLGTLNLFSVRHASTEGGSGGNHVGYQNFDATQLIGRVGTENFSVQIVPYSLYTAPPGAASLRSDGVRIGQVELLLEE